MAPRFHRGFGQALFQKQPIFIPRSAILIHFRKSDHACDPPPALPGIALCPTCRTWTFVFGDGRGIYQAGRGSDSPHPPISDITCHIVCMQWEIVFNHGTCSQQTRVSMVGHGVYACAHGKGCGDSATHFRRFSRTSTFPSGGKGRQGPGYGTQALRCRPPYARVTRWLSTAHPVSGPLPAERIWRPAAPATHTKRDRGKLHLARSPGAVWLGFTTCLVPH